MRKLFFISVTWAILLISCSDSNSEENIIEPIPSYKLLKQLEYDNNDNLTETLTYSYDSNGQLTKVVEESQNEIFISNIIYENEKIISIKYNDNTQLDFIYTEDLITSSSGFEDNINIVHKYTYNSSHQMIKNEQYSNGNLNNVITYEYDSNGNLSKVTYDGSIVISYTYDTNNNPNSLIFPDAITKIFGVGKNNILTKDIVNYEYEYNEELFPTKSTEIINGEVYAITEYIYGEVN